MKKFLLGLFIGLSFITTTAYALSTYLVIQGGTGATTLTGCLTGNGTSAITGSGNCFPFTSQSWGNSTSSVIGFNGYFSTASSTQSGPFFLTGLSQGFVYTGTNGLVNTVASSSINLSGFNNDLAALTATNASLTFSGSYNGSTARTVGLNLGNTNTWTILQNFNYSSSTIYSSFLNSSSTFGYFGSLTLATTSAGCAAVMSTGLVTSIGSPCGAGTVTAIGVTANQGVTGSSSGGATPNLTISLGALTGVTSLNGLIVTANTGVITTGTWNGTKIAVANGGTNATAFAAGSVITSDAAGTTLIATTSQLTVGSLLSTSTSLSTFIGGLNVGTSSVGIFSSSIAAHLIASTTQPQLALQGGVTDPLFSFRSIGGSLYIATSSSILTATSSASIFQINTNGLFKWTSYGAGAVQTDASGNVTTGTLSIGNGGTNATACANTNGIWYWDNTRYVCNVNTSANTILVGNNAAPSFSASPTIGTSVTTPIVIGGSGTGSSLELRSTSGVGVTDFIKITTGSNGAQENARFLVGGYTGFGTTTPARFLATFASSTVPQLSLGDGVAGDAQWFFRALPTGLLIGTSTAQGLATTSIPALQINTTGVPSFTIGTSTPDVTLKNGTLVLGGGGDALGQTGSTTIATGKIQFDGMNSAGAPICVFANNSSAWVVVSGRCTP